MKSLALLALVSLPAFSAEYIVKFNNSKSLAAFSNARVLNVSVGNFAVVKSEDKNFIATASQMAGIEYAEKAGYYSNTETDKRNAEYGVHA